MRHGYIALFSFCAKILLIHGSDDYREPRDNIGKCEDYCHLQHIPYLLCINEDKQVAANPWESCRYCKSDDFKLKYLLPDGKHTEKRRNRVNKTEAGEAAPFKYLCLDERGLPQALKCEARKGKAKWQDKDDILCFEARALSSNLNQLVIDNPPDLIPRLSEILIQSNESLTPVDVSSVAEIMRNEVQKPERNASFVSHLIDINLRVMQTEPETLRLSAELNATNLLLSNFEEYLNEVAPQLLAENRGPTLPMLSKEVKTEIFDGLGVIALTSRNLSVFFVNPDIANVTGIAVQSLAAADQPDFTVIYSSEISKNIRNLPNLETAAFLPDKLWRAVKTGGARYLIFKVYKQDALFVETEAELERRPTSSVISITISGWKEHDLPEKLPFFLRNKNTEDGQSHGGCGYWNYQTWLNDGVAIDDSSNTQQDVVLCFASHLTQFTFLLGVHGKNNDPVSNYALDIITYIGCCLSLVGILIIFLTAVLFKSFRNMASTQLLLNFCFALVLQLMFFLFATNVDFFKELNPTSIEFDGCIVMGAVMQYLLLVVFSWMLIIGFLQYKRYVKVIGVEHPAHYILMSAIAAWSLPLIPTLLVVFLDPQAYRPKETSQELPITCYPSGYGLIFGVITPIGLVTLVNTLIVGYITWSVYTSLFRRNLILEQMRLFAMLFFLLGISWLFGLFTVFGFGVVFEYLFCMTAPLQGFLLFVSFILCNKHNRQAWLGLCCRSSRIASKSDQQGDPTEMINSRGQQSLTSSTQAF
ncbi:hypothetical protein KR018_000041 [Drosophila ironensis]|nr:hypothetical protein KR018_000041 [Drosophila ironensis]